MIKSPREDQNAVTITSQKEFDGGVEYKKMEHLVFLIWRVTREDTIHWPNWLFIIPYKKSMFVLISVRQFLNRNFE